MLKERAHEFFEVRPDHDSPYMLLVAPVQQAKRRPLTVAEATATGIAKLQVHRSEVPAITHVDFSARVQTVDRERHGLYWQLLDSFNRKTGCPVIVNTSFNLGWEPIVCTPKEAYDTFMGSDIDVLCMGHFVLEKAAQPAWIEVGDAERPEAIVDEVWCSPCHQAPLEVSAGQAACSACGHRYPFVDGIPQMFYPHDTFADAADVTERVKSFYEEMPYPSYDGVDSVRTLIDKSRRGQYESMLNDAIPYNSTVLDVGCGTGQLTNFLGIGCRRVIGADLSLNALRLGRDFAREQGLPRVKYVQMNLFRPCFKPQQFDVVICNGVLHHTSDPVNGLQQIARLVKPGGHIVIGLYNTYGRLMTDTRRLVPGAAPHRHPHGSTHTIGEVLNWFRESDLEFVRGIPRVTLGGEDANRHNLFTPSTPGSKPDHFWVQASRIVNGHREGGSFLMIARRPSAVTAAATQAQIEKRLALSWQ